ncbi:MAG TPA: hypothetical protein VMV77_06820 [Bacteroidales bacterium]|nr:hypothetical protein [Bacteroidales bacterium]
MPRRKDKYFDIAFAYRGVAPWAQGKEGESYLEVTYDAAEE